MNHFHITKVIKNSLNCVGVLGYFLMLYGIGNNTQLSGVGALMLFGVLILLNIHKNKEEISPNQETESEFLNKKSNETGFPSPDPTLDNK